MNRSDDSRSRRGGSGSKRAGHEIGVFEHVSPDVYAMHCRLDPEPDEQEPQQFPVVLQERVVQGTTRMLAPE